VILGVVRLACSGQQDLMVVGEATTGEEAVALLAEVDVDVVVLDLDLADMDGLDALRRFRRDGFAGSVLALSDRADGATVLEAMRSGADGYLTKAEGLRSVASAIREVGAGGHVLDASLERSAVLELGRFARQAREGSEVAATLTPREREILDLLSQGLTMRQIGRRLGISPRTVETHVAKLYRKLSVRTRVQAVARAASLGLIEFK